MNTTEAPVRTVPTTEPRTEPIRRLEPERICPNQKNRIVRRIERELP
jgi:hypothetical protein